MTFMMKNKLKLDKQLGLNHNNQLVIQLVPLIFVCVTLKYLHSWHSAKVEDCERAAAVYYNDNTVNTTTKTFLKAREK